MTIEAHDDQQVLGQALAAARAGEDRALAQRVRDAGEQAVRLLTGLWRLMRSHSADNHAFDVPVRDFALVLARLIDLLGPIHIVCVEGQTYVNDIRIRLDERIGGAADLEEELGKHQSGGLHFDEVLSETQIRELLRVLAGKPTERMARNGLGARLHDASLPMVRASGLYRLRLSGEVNHAQDDVRDVPTLLHRAATQLADALDQLRAGRALNPLPVRRLVNDIVDATLSATPEVQAALIGTPVHPSAQAGHAVRVCALAVLIGRELGLSRGPLSDLGVGAIFHDVGYAVAEGAGESAMARHPSAGARLLLRQRGFHAAKVKRLLVTLDHHRSMYSGPTLHGRIVCIADDYDTMTRPRLTGARFNPFEALERMQAVAGERYDAVLFQLFVNRLGRYPPGTVLRLGDEQTVVVTSVARSEETFARPICRVLQGEARGDDGGTVDLAEGGEIREVLPP